MALSTRDRSRGCLLGLAAGDAVGTTVEFMRRGSFAPLTDMVGGGPFNLRPGEWTDDTSMALCLAASLIDRAGFDAADQMNRYSNWYEHGYMSSNGRCFDIGNTVRAALVRYLASGDPYAGSTDPHSAGNGSIMRLAPVAIRFQFAPDQALHWAVDSSRTTHAAVECLEACQLLTTILLAALRGESKQHVLDAGRTVTNLTSGRLKEIAASGYRSKTAAAIKGSGYVMDSLEAALWAFATTDTFRDAVLAAANLGDDADTTAAVCGQVAGAHYGYAAIPAAWRDALVMRDAITEMADQLHDAGQ